MDLGCIDMGCIEKGDEINSKDSVSSATKNSKNKSPKGSPPSANALKRVTSQIRKPPHRKTSPVNWFPRKKVESYLKRKIRSLQEAGGMNDTLDETLGHANPHYCRVLREKMAAKEAACKVMEARKAAMVEASWCRILQAARIPNKEADSLLIKAEKEVAEAIEAAKAKGVTMYDTPDRPRKHLEIETSSTTGKGSTTHTVKASFETAFEVDKQVAAAVKTAFVRLAHCSSCKKDEYKDLLRKISENPDTQELSDSDNGSEIEAEICDDGSKSETRSRKKLIPQKVTALKLVDMMLERLKCLKEEELASLATIVATCGLNAALSEIGSNNMAKDKIEATSIEHFMHGVRKKHDEPELPSLDKFLVKKMTRLEKEVHEAKNARKSEFKTDDDGNHDTSDEPELPSLDKFLVKKMSRLEMEVQEAKNARKSEFRRDDDGNHDTSDNIPDLGSVLVKHSSKLEKEIEEAKRNQKLSDVKTRQLQEETEVPSLDKFLVKHVTKLEREVQEAKNRQITTEDVREKENVDSNRTVTTVSLEMEQNEKEVQDETGGKDNSLEKILVRPLMTSSQPKDSDKWTYIKKQQGNPNENQCESLEKCLIKHVSKLEKAKLEVGTKESFEVKKKNITMPTLNSTVGGLDQILVKPKSRIQKERENEKVVALEQLEVGNKNSTMSRREARERELLETWGGLGLGGTMRPHVSRLQRDKAAWIKAEEQERNAALQEQQHQV